MLKEETLKEEVTPKEEETPCDRGSRNHTIVTYIEPKYLENWLKSCSWVSHWAYCYHDKDDKEPHTHILLHTKDAKTYTAICKQFDRFSVSIYGKEKKQNTRSQYCTDVWKQYRYLIHADDPDKYQYPPESRIVDNFHYWDKFHNGCYDSPNLGYVIVNEILAGIPERVLVQKYGKDYVYHSKQYHDSARVIMMEENLCSNRVDDDLIYSTLKSSHFTDKEVSQFFGMITYLREKFSDLSHTNKFELYLDRLGQNDSTLKIRKDINK